MTPLVLGEADYFESSRIPYAWAEAVLVGRLCGSTCVFVGHSMTDPSLRRLLRLSFCISARKHFAFLLHAKATSDRGPRMFQALFDTDLDHLGVSVIRYPLLDIDADTTSAHSRLPELIRSLEAGHNDPRRLWESST